MGGAHQQKEMGLVLWLFSLALTPKTPRGMRRAVRTQQKEMGLVLRLFSLSTARWLKNSGDAPARPSAQVTPHENTADMAFKSQVAWTQTFRSALA